MPGLCNTNRASFFGYLCKGILWLSAVPLVRADRPKPDQAHFRALPLQYGLGALGLSVLGLQGLSLGDARDTSSVILIINNDLVISLLG